MKKSLAQTNDENYQAIALYYSGTTDVELREDQKAILERWRTAHAILRKYPRPYVAAKMLQSRYPEISLAQARVDIQSATRLWNVSEKVDRDFIESWFVDTLLKEISNQGASEAVKARNLQTLGAWLKAQPPVEIDPHLVERNQINIVFNTDNRQIVYSEADIMRLKPADRERLLGSMPNSLTEAQAAEILNS
ncbi:MAG: hypothetical protein K6G79_04180 [Bacteroidales bacterium]|nr:hypothetical protein [Bacteroidales bacterium]